MDYVSSGFPDVDQAESTDFFFTCLETLNTLPFFQDYKKESFRALKVGPGSKVLDVGCGLGFDVISMGRMVGESGRVVGQDLSSAMVSQARQRSDGLGLPIEFVTGDARSLDFGDDTFDCTRVDRSLQHMPDPARVLSEMARVTKGGGMMMAFEPDWGTFAVGSSNRQVTRNVLDLFCDNFRSGWIGRDLYSLFIQCGLLDIRIDPRVLMINEFRVADKVWDLERNAFQAYSLGLISRKDADDWISELKALDAAGRFFACHICFLVSGRKP